MAHHNYPKWIFKQGEAPRLVQTKADHEALGSGYFENPAFMGEEPRAEGSEPPPAAVSDAKPTQHYPKVLYSKTAAPVTVADETAHQALGAGWYESPDCRDVGDEGPPPPDGFPAPRAPRASRARV